MTIQPNESVNRDDHAFPVRLYLDSSKPESLTHRLSIMRWKETKDKITKAKTPAISPARFVSIPLLTLVIEPAIISKAMQASLESLQDEYIKERVTDDILSGLDQPRSLHASDLTVEAVAIWYSTAKQGAGKLSKELIENWFESEMEPVLSEALAQLTSIDTDEKLAANINARRLAFMKLSAPSFSMTENDAKQLLKALEKLEEPDTIADRLQSRLTTFLKPAMELITENL